MIIKVVTKKAGITWIVFLFAFLITNILAFLTDNTAAAQEPSEEIWIDVRSPQEYKKQHFETAVNIPFMQIMQRITDVTTDLQANIRLYSAEGDRAAIAKQILESMGYENVVNEGGLKNIKQNFNRN